MVRVSCCFYSSEYKKVFKLLNDMKQDGWIIKSINFKDGKAEFIEVDNDFVYGIDYSLLYPHLKCFFNDGYERFDMIRLSGWKLQCFDEGIGIWIHEDTKYAVPFFLDEEYKKIEQVDYQKNLRSLKKWLKSLLGLFCLDIFSFIIDKEINFYYQSLFLMFIIFISLWKIKHYQLIHDKVYNVLFINYAVAFCFSYYPFYLSIVLEAITLLVSIDLVREKSLILKKTQILGIYNAIIIIIVMYAAFVYKI